jgi:hypothetical protein
VIVCAVPRQAPGIRQPAAPRHDNPLPMGGQE